MINKQVKGIILAGGKGTRLHPITKIISKHLLPIYKKPMIFYSVDLLKKMGIEKILIISDKKNIKLLRILLDSSYKYKNFIEYKVQKQPNGIGEAFIIGEKFIGNNNVCLILGDNIFYGGIDLLKILKSSLNNLKNNFCTIIGKKVKNTQDFGIAYFNKKKQLSNIIEKPKKSSSKTAVLGLYFFTNDVVQKAKTAKPSKRGELEITSIIKMFINEKKIKLKNLKNTFWADCGTFESLLNASNKIKSFSRLNK